MDKNLKKLLIKTKKAIFSQKIGNNSSRLRGEGYDFSHLREYEDGEDIRKIDWVISAKMQKPYVKIFYSQRELDINIVPILNGSVYFGTSRFKQEVISEVCAALAYSCVTQGDNCTGFIANEDVVLNTKPTKKFANIEMMIKDIYEYNARGKRVNYKNIIEQLHSKIRKKSIIFLIGDFFEDSKSFSLRDSKLKLLAKKHEVIAIVIRDKFEESPKEFENINFTDPSNFKIFEGNISKKNIREYERVVRENDKQLYQQFKTLGVQFAKIYTDESIYPKLFKLLH